MLSGVVGVPGTAASLTCRLEAPAWWPWWDSLTLFLVMNLEKGCKGCGFRGPAHLVPQNSHRKSPEKKQDVTFSLMNSPSLCIISDVFSPQLF